MANIELYNEDCMELMKRYPDNYFELAIVDPPYGIGASSFKKYARSRFTSYEKKDWDSSIPNEYYFKELFRVSQNQIIWGGNYFPLPMCEKWVIWDKQIPDGCSFGHYELAWTSDFSKGKIFKLSSSWNNGGNTRQLSQLNKPRRIHPTQKPLTLYKWLLTNYAKQGDKILDTHGGSMSIAIACHDLGFDLVLSELDKDYFEAGKKRLENHRAQVSIFDVIKQDDAEQLKIEI